MSMLNRLREPLWGGFGLIRKRYSTVLMRWSGKQYGGFWKLAYIVIKHHFYYEGLLMQTLVVFIDCTMYTTNKLHNIYFDRKYGIGLHHVKYRSKATPYPGLSGGFSFCVHKKEKHDRALNRVLGKLCTILNRIIFYVFKRAIKNNL